jgi:enoyl-CoA hydratase
MQSTLKDTNQEPALQVKDHGAVRWIIFNRPTKHNAQNREMLESLDDVLRETRRNKGVRVVVLGGNGPSFCSGHDLRSISYDEEYANSVSTAEGRYRREEDLFVGPVEAFQNLPMPTICRVQGACLAAALMFVSVSDFVIASDDSYYGSPVISTLGVNDAEVPSFSWRIGDRRAKQALWLNERIDATEAYRIGLVNWVVPLAELDSKVSEVSEKLLQAPPEALALSKASFRFMADRQGERDFSTFHFVAHQLSHETYESKTLLKARIEKNARSI